jgi:hypothetical protein
VFYIQHGYIFILSERMALGEAGYTGVKQEGSIHNCYGVKTWRRRPYYQEGRGTFSGSKEELNM